MNASQYPLARSALFRGAVGGFAGTIPMTLTMELLRRLPDGRVRSRFTPRRVAMGVAEKAGVRKHLDEPSRVGVTLVGHFAFGTAVGSLFPVTAQRLRWPVAAQGAVFGLAVWASSYLGWLPALGIVPPPSRRPLREEAILIAAHAVWGVSLGLISERLGRRAS